MVELKGNRLGSIGELTAVASAKRAVLGDFSDGGLLPRGGVVVLLLLLLVESSDEARGRVATVTVGVLFSLSDIASEGEVCLAPLAIRFARDAADSDCW